MKQISFILTWTNVLNQTAATRRFQAETSATSNIPESDRAVGVNSDTLAARACHAESASPVYSTSSAWNNAFKYYFIFRSSSNGENSFYAYKKQRMNEMMNQSYLLFLTNTLRQVKKVSCCAIYEYIFF